MLHAVQICMLTSRKACLLTFLFGCMSSFRRSCFHHCSIFLTLNFCTSLPPVQCSLRSHVSAPAMPRHVQFIGHDESWLDAVPRDLDLHWLACSVFRSTRPLNASCGHVAPLMLVMLSMPDHVQVRCERLHDAFVLIHILPCASHLRKGIILVILFLTGLVILFLPVLVMLFPPVLVMLFPPVVAMLQVVAAAAAIGGGPFIAPVFP